MYNRTMLSLRWNRHMQSVICNSANIVSDVQQPHVFCGEEQVHVVCDVEQSHLESDIELSCVVSDVE